MYCLWARSCFFFFPSLTPLLCKKAENGSKKWRKTIGREACKNPVTNRLLWPVKHKHRVQLDLFKCLGLFPRPSFVLAMPEWCVDSEFSRSFLTRLPHLERRVTSAALPCQKTAALAKTWRSQRKTNKGDDSHCQAQGTYRGHVG